MAARFEISKDDAGKFRFHPKAPNGEIIAASQGYETKASAWCVHPLVRRLEYGDERQDLLRGQVHWLNPIH
jgi:uncharacterized protein YegP (UPF0339 family)